MHSNLKRILICITEDSFEEIFHSKFYALASAVSSALLISHDVRRDAILNLFFLQDNLLISIIGSKVRQLRPDEQSIKGIFRKILQTKILSSSRRIHSGILARRTKLENVIRECVKGTSKRICIISSNKGIDIRQLNFRDVNLIVALLPLIKLEENFEKRYNIKDIFIPTKISVSTKLGYRMIVILNNEIDRQIYT